MTQFEQLDLLVAEHLGIIQASQAREIGISKAIFYAFVRERNLRKAAHGIYVLEDAWPDSMYMLHLRCEQAIFSHETALFLHDLTDREPIQYAITVKTGYNPSKLQSDGFKVYTIKGDLHPIGLTTANTNFGHTVPVYDVERTICDIVRSRSEIEIQTFQDALKRYAHLENRNIRALMHYASLFRVERIIRQYLGVLL